jgi:hypothetical protein
VLSGYFKDLEAREAGRTTYEIRVDARCIRYASAYWRVAEKRSGIEIPDRRVDIVMMRGISRLMEVDADLRLPLDGKDAGRDAGVEAAEKAEREREAPRRKRERAALEQWCERPEEQCDDFKRQLRDREIALAAKKSVHVDGCTRRAVARHMSEMERLTAERATLHDELVSLREELKKANDSCDGCRQYNQRVRWSGMMRERSTERRRPSSDEREATTSVRSRSSRSFVATWRITCPSMVNSSG